MIETGSYIRYKTSWLKSVGLHTRDISSAKGVVKQLTSSGQSAIAEISWDTPNVPKRVSVRNLERVY